jgi:hypothetical protein
MPTSDRFLSRNPRYAKATEGPWEKIEPGSVAMSVAAGPNVVCDITPRGAREPGAWADEEFANAMLIADAKKNAALAMLLEDLLTACARAEQDYRTAIDVLSREGRGCFPRSISEATAMAGHLANLQARAAELKAD